MSLTRRVGHLEVKDLHISFEGLVEQHLHIVCDPELLLALSTVLQIESDSIFDNEHVKLNDVALLQISTEGPEQDADDTDLSSNLTCLRVDVAGHLI